MAMMRGVAAVAALVLMIMVVNCNGLEASTRKVVVANRKLMIKPRREAVMVGDHREKIGYNNGAHRELQIDDDDHDHDQGNGNYGETVHNDSTYNGKDNNKISGLASNNNNGTTTAANRGPNTVNNHHYIPRQDFNNYGGGDGGGGSG